MKQILAIIFLMAVTIIAAAACRHNTTLPDDEIEIQDADTAKTNPSIADSDSVINFRYETYQMKDNGLISAVYFVSKSEDLQYIYYRELGSRFAMSYTGMSLDEALTQLTQAARNLKLDSYPRTPLSKENKDRARWMVEIEYASGDKVKVVEYSNSPRSEQDLAIEQTLIPIFSKVYKEVDELFEKPGEFSSYTYDDNGELSRRIDYLSDGTVRGGYDADDPLATF